MMCYLTMQNKIIMLFLSFFFLLFPFTLPFAESVLVKTRFCGLRLKLFEFGIRMARCERRFCRRTGHTLIWIQNPSMCIIASSKLSVMYLQVYLNTWESVHVRLHVHLHAYIHVCYIHNVPEWTDNRLIVGGGGRQLLAG